MPKVKERKVELPRLIDVLPLLMKMVPEIKLERIEKHYPVFQGRTIYLKRDRIPLRRTTRTIRQRIPIFNKAAISNYKAPTTDTIESSYKVPTNDSIETSYKVPTNDSVEASYKVRTNDSVESSYKVPTNDSVESSYKVPTSDRMVTSYKAAINDKLPTNDRVANSNKAVTNDKLPTNDRVANSNKVVTNDKIPTNDRVANSNKAVTNDKLPTNDRVANSNKAVTNNKLPTYDRVANSNKVVTNDKLPTSDRVANSYKVRNNYTTVNYQLASKYKMQTANNDDDDDDDVNDDVLFEYEMDLANLSQDVTIETEIIKDDEQGTVVVNLVPEARAVTYMKEEAAVISTSVPSDTSAYVGQSCEDVNMQTYTPNNGDVKGNAENSESDDDIVILLDVKKNDTVKERQSLVMEHQPISTDQQPISMEQQPISTVQQPIRVQQQPVSTVQQQPISMVQQPIRVQQQPISTVQQPISMVQQPISMVQQPISMVQQPISTVQQPISMVQQPITMVQQPVTTVQQPISTVQQPINMVQQQPIRVQQQASSTQEESNSKSEECMSILSTSWALADCVSAKSPKHSTEEIEVIDCLDDDDDDNDNSLSKVNYPCISCNNVFATKRAFSTHACSKSELNKGLEGFLCPCCERRYLNIKGLKEHVKSCWKGMLTCVVCSANISGKPEVVRHLQQHKKKSPEIITREKACLICGLFDEKWKLMEHWRVHTGVNLLECVVCKKVIDPVSYEEHIIAHRQNDPGWSQLNMCRSCGLTFTDRGAFYNHRNGHMSKKYTHLCESCGLFFDNFDDLEQHVLYHVDQNTVYKCGKCNRIYPFWTHFEIHCKTCFKLGESSTTADTAQKLKIIREEYLKIFNTHTIDLIRHGIKKNIKVQQNIQRQEGNSSGMVVLKLRKEEEGVVLFSCQLCQKQLFGNESFMRHWREHTGYDPNKCVICSETFNTPKLLEIHLSIAHPTCFKCSTCSMVFNTYLESKYHSVAHMRNNLYFCEVCGRGFDAFNYLELHVFTSHVKDYAVANCQVNATSASAVRHSTSTRETQNGIVGSMSNVVQPSGSHSATAASGSAESVVVPAVDNPLINTVMMQVGNVTDAIPKSASPIVNLVPLSAAQQTSTAVQDFYMCTVCKALSPDLAAMVEHAKSHQK